MSRMVGLPLVHRRVRMIYLVVFVAIIAVSVSAFAATVTIQTTTAQGYQGIYVQDNGYYNIEKVTYNVVQTSQGATTPAPTWTTNGTAWYVNGLTAGHWELQFTLHINAGGPLSTLLTITMYTTPANGVATVLYTFQFNSPASITAGQTMYVLYDIGTTTWTTPVALSATIA